MRLFYVLVCGGVCGLQVILDGCGYLEERRPAANADPYAVTEMMVRTIILDEGLENIANTDDSISLYSDQSVQYINLGGWK